MPKKPNEDTGILDYIKDKMMGGGMADQASQNIQKRPDRVQQELDKAMGVTPDVKPKRK